VSVDQQPRPRNWADRCNDVVHMAAADDPCPWAGIAVVRLPNLWIEPDRPQLTDQPFANSVIGRRIHGMRPLVAQDSREAAKRTLGIEFTRLDACGRRGRRNEDSL